MSSQIVYVINEINAEQVAQDEALSTLEKVVEVLRHQPGFLTASVYVSMQENRIVSTISWATAQDAKTAQQSPELLPLVGRLSEITTMRPGVFRLTLEAGA